MPLLYNLWVWTMFMVVTAVFGTLAILTSWVPPRGWIYQFWARWWAGTVLFLCRFPVRVEMAEAARSTREAIFMANHTSAVDILVLFVALRRDVRFVAKKGLFWIPLLGWSMWLAGFIPVDRENREKAREAFDRIGRYLKEGISILVFPEGTRSRTGQLGEFKKAGFLLAMRAGLPIVPVGISGARAVLGADGLKAVRGPITVRVGEPVSPVGYTFETRGEFVRRVRAEILRLGDST
jgi:1-acyl-sn-glycerol-3-phosphate acyltransferase